MTKAIERAKAHFKQLLDEPKVIRVPEWDDESSEFTIFCTPLTLNERMRLNKFSANGVEMTAELIIMKAKDKDGNAHFTKEDKPELMRSVDSNVLGRIGKLMIGEDQDAAVEEAEKN
jgi:hypothetical protein